MRILSALYYSDRGEKHDAMAFVLNKMDIAVNWEEKNKRADLEEVYGCGAGCLMIRREVLTDIDFRVIVAGGVNDDCYFALSVLWLSPSTLLFFTI